MPVVRIRSFCKFRRLALLPAVALLAAALAAGCDSGSACLRTRQSSDPIKIVCTTGMVADVVRNVGGKQVQVTQLMGEGIDPHTYKSSPGDVTKMKDADLVFYSGLHLEANLQPVFDSLANEKPVYALTAELERWHHDRLIATSGDQHDPHVWFDVSLWKQTVRFVADRLADFDPKNATTYANNALAYMKKLDALHEECRAELATIPTERRVMVTAHDAFSYFGRAYGIQVKAIQGVSTASEASLKHVEELIAYMVANKIPAVFVESSVNEASMKQLIAGCAAKGHTVKRGGELFSDAMGAEGTKDGTYEGMIRHNVRVIVHALR